MKVSVTTWGPVKYRCEECGALLEQCQKAKGTYIHPYYKVWLFTRWAVSCRFAGKFFKGPKMEMEEA